MDYTNVTEKMQRVYKDSPDICPFCGSGELDGGHFDANYNTAWRDVQCQTCGMTWTENFSLTHIDRAYNTKEDE